jgi:integrase
MPKALTVAAVAKVKPKLNPKRRREIPDGLLPGLYLIVQPSGAKSWAVRYRHGRKSRKHTLGSYPALELKDARDEARKALQQVQKGADPAQEKKIQRRRADVKADDFEAIARLFIERHQKPKNRSWKETARLLGLGPDKAKAEAAGDPKSFVAAKGGLVAKWSDRKIGDISKADILAAIDDIVDRGAPIIANRTLAALRTLFNWALGRALIDLSPCAGVKPPAPEKSRDRMLSDDELRAVWNAAGEIGWPFGDITRLLILTGQRRDEVAQMEWSEIDLERKLWTLPRGRVKNDNGHEVPLSAHAIEIIRKLPRLKDCAFVFSTTGNGPVSGFAKAKERLDEKAGVAHWRLHDLRRTVASGMARLGIALPVIEKVLNHSSGSFRGIVGVYQRHSFSDEKRAALDAWAAQIERIVNPPGDNVIELRAGTVKTG